MADVWAPLRYGWSHVYWLAIEGIPIVWSERALAKTVPSGFASESATLVVDGSARIGAMVGRDEAIAAGFPLSFRLLDDAIDDYMIRPTAQTYLTAAETSAAGTIDVASSTGLTSPVWIGRERVTYSGSTATTLTGCTRGTAGYAWPHRKGAIVTSGAPRSWRGRLVTLYAQPIDPTGYAPGAAWASTSVAIWRGYLDTEPQRATEGDGWLFQAAALDRMLARPLAAALTGEVVDLEPRFQVANDEITITIRRYVAAGTMTLSVLQVTPFATAGYAAGTWISLTQANTAIAYALTTAATAAAKAWVTGGLVMVAQQDYYAAGVFKGENLPKLKLGADASTLQLEVHGRWFGSDIKEQKRVFPAAGILAAEEWTLGISYTTTPYDFGPIGVPAKYSTPAATVRFDNGDPGAIPTTGQIVLGDDTYTYTTTQQTTDAATITFGGLAPSGSTSGAPVAIGATAKIEVTDTGTLAEVALHLLHSSGEASLRGAYDTLPGWMGYGLPTALTSDTTIAAALASGHLAVLDLQASPSGKSLEDVCGGLLRLAGLALAVVDQPNSDAVLTVVDLSAAASGAAVDLLDEHVICYPDRAAQQTQIEAPSALTVKMAVGDTEIGTIRLIDQDRSRDEGAGRPGIGQGTAEYEVPIADRSAMLPAAASYGLARLVGDSLASVVEIDVVPWLDVRPGDAVDVLLTLPELWTWSTGASGYTGRARCVGRSVSLETGVQTLRLLIDGQAGKGANLCPSAAVSAVAGGATTPTSVDIHRDYYAIMSTAYTERGGTYMRVLSYEPGGGAEGTTRYLDISAVTDTGAVCRLTVAAYSLPAAGVSTSQGWVTWPHSASDDAWQAQWMHDADATRWV